jgi:nucleoside-diphosphate-sugar epimerase
MQDGCADTRPVLVTGGCGFVGRRFCRRLADAGRQVVAVDDMSSESAIPPWAWPEHLRPAQGSPQVQLVVQDVRDFVRRGPPADAFSMVLHLAAVVGGRANLEGNPLQVARDLAIDADVVGWAARTGAPTSARGPGTHLVYFSSSAAYPVNLQGGGSEGSAPLKESDLDPDAESFGAPDLTYGWSKLTGEMLARAAHRMHGLRCVCYRPFSGYGEDQHPCYPFPAIVRRAALGEGPVDVWSDAVRDFVYVEDVVDCVLSTMGAVNDGSAINVATGRGTSMSQLARAALAAAGREGEEVVVRSEGRPQGVAHRVGCPARAADLGFLAATPLERGLELAVAYVRGRIS